MAQALKVKRLHVHKTPELAERKFKQYKSKILFYVADAEKMTAAGKTAYADYSTIEVYRLTNELRRWGSLNDYAEQAEAFIADLP